MGMSDKGVGERGVGFMDLGKVIRGSFPGSFTVWVGDVGDETMY